MSPGNASQHEVRTDNDSALYYQSGDASIVLSRRWETSSPAIAVDRNSSSLPTPILEERRSCGTSEFFDLSGYPLRDSYRPWSLCS
jgi:hypothetical protein